MTSNQESPNDPIHGNIYQLKLLMLFLYRGIRHKYDFDLGTEIPEAKKFDDIVFGYNEQNDLKFRLLQAKHRIDESKKIRAEDLLTNRDTDFSLTKYYFSYHESKSEELFKNGSIKDIIICTNIDFDLSDLQKAGITLDPVTESDPILDIGNANLPIKKKPVRWKLNPRISTKLKEVIESSFIPKLANKVAFFLLNSKTISKEGYLFGQYQYVLRNEVIDVKNKRFKEDFITNKNLTKDAEKFRFLLNTEILIQSKGTIQMEDLNDIITKKKIINEKTIGLAVRKDFGKGMSPDEKWPSTSVSIDDINEYLGVLVFAVNQLDEQELGQVIMKEIGNQFNTITTEHVYNKIFQRMLSWIQGKNSEGEREGHSLHPWTDGKRLIDDARKEILDCLAPDCKKMLEDVSFCFNSHTEVETFLASEYGIWLLPTETPWLSTLLVYHTVKNIPNRSSFFFNWQNAISSNGKIISDFQDLDDFLIVLTCNQLINAEDIRDDLSLTMKKISDSGTSKKVIIITPTNEALSGTLKHKFQIAYESKIKIEFNNLDDKSKEIFLGKKNIIFSGSCEKLCLNQLLCCSTRMENFTLDAKEIELILDNSEVKVWTEYPQQFNPSCNNYKANEILTSNQIREAIQFNESDIFSFFGSLDDTKKLVESEKKELQEFRSAEISDLLKTHHLFLINDGEEKEEFNLLCQMASNVCESKPSVHMLKSLGNDEWLWMQTYSQNIYIRRYFKPHLLQKFVVKSICSPQSSQFMIFSGMMENEFFDLLPDIYTSLKVSNKLYNYKVLNSERDAEKEFNNMKQRILQKRVSAHDDVAESFYCEEVHWLNAWKEEGDLMLAWHQSFGNLGVISLHLVSHDRFLPEDSLIKLKQRVIVLSDNPGMGKSSSLNRLADHLKKTNPLSVIIKLDLNDNQEELTQLCEYSKAKLVRTLMHIKPNKEQSSLSRKILEHKLEYPEQVFILCDAFDEVAEDEQENLLKWFDFVLENTKASIWITTRPNNQEKLKNHFSVFSYSFKTLEKYEQTDYLNRFWKMSLAFSSGVNQNVSDFYSIANKVIEHFKSVLVKRQPESFVQIPLMLRMLAEKYVEVVRDISLNSTQDYSLQVQIINCLTTYKAFVDHVFEIYFFDKIKANKWLDNDSKIVLKNAYSKAYGQLALTNECARNLRDPVINLGNKKGSISLNTLSRIGLIQSHGSLITKSMFIHSSFEEYFAVNVVFHKLLKNQEIYIWWEFLLNVILMRSFSRRIFDDKLEKNSLLLNGEAISIIFKILLQQVKSNTKHVVLWIAAADDLKRTVDLLSSSMKYSELEQILKLERGTLHKIQNIPAYRRLYISIHHTATATLKTFIIERGKSLFIERDITNIVRKKN